MSYEMIELGVRPQLNTGKLEKVHELVLRAVERGRDPVLAEGAREVREGRLTLREAATSSAYQETFAAAADKAIGTIQESDLDYVNEDSVDKCLDNVVESLTGWDEQADNDAAPDEQPDTAPTADTASTDDEEYFSDMSVMTAPSDSKNPGDTDAAPQQARWQRRW